METTEVIHAYAHENIRATHKTTFEVTKEPRVSKRGDCIIAVDATKGAVDFHPAFKESARSENAKITIKIEAGAIVDVVKAKGTHRLLFTDPTDAVVRRSDYVCGRTVAIGADKAAADLSRKLIKELQTKDQEIRITLKVENY